jgi:hypothetical protein
MENGAEQVLSRKLSEELCGNDDRFMYEKASPETVSSQKKGFGLPICQASHDGLSY